MDVERVRGTVVDYTRKQLRMNGIKRVRMDDIAREVGISKRTIYKLFASKETLVGFCLNIFSRNGRELFQQYMSRKACSPVYRSLATVNCYIVTLYQMERILLAELEVNAIYQPAIRREREFWYGELLHSLEGVSFCPVIESTPSEIAENILDLFLSNCKNGYPFASQLWIAYLLVRGLAGSGEIAEIGEMDKEVKYEWERLSTILQSWSRPTPLHTRRGMAL